MSVNKPQIADFCLIFSFFSGDCIALAFTLMINLRLILFAPLVCKHNLQVLLSYSPDLKLTGLKYKFRNK